MSEVLEQMSTEELEKLLKERKNQERLEREKKRQGYEAERDKLVESMMHEAVELSLRTAAFKDACHKYMTDQEAKLNEYGEIRGNSKGGFSLTHSNGTLRVTRRRDTEPFWDERGNKAVTLIREFLQDSVKKSNKKLFEILMGFLEKNQKGDLEYSSVFSLMKHKDKYNDPRWTEGLNLLAESYGNNLKGYGYEFKRKDASGKWETVTLNFSAL